MPAAAPQPAFEIWQVAGRIHSIENPVRLQILRLLEARARSLGELAAQTKKAKSTLSALHLAALLETGLVREEPVPQDARTKLYRLAGQRLGSSSVRPTELRDAVLRYVQAKGAVPLGTILEILNPDQLVASGAERAYIQWVARSLGRSTGRLLMSQGLEGSVMELDQLLRGQNLGSARLEAASKVRVDAPRPRLQEFVALLSEAALEEHLHGPVAIAGPPRRRLR